jgi:hypothetical protein
MYTTFQALWKYSGVQNNEYYFQPRRTYILIQMRRIKSYTQKHLDETFEQIKY